MNNYSSVERSATRLTKFKRALDNLKKAKSELEEVYKATVRPTKRLCKDDAEGDVGKEVDEHIEQTRGKVAEVPRSSEATTCTSCPGASPVALSEGQCCVLDEPFSGFPSPIQSNGGELLKRAFINTMAHSRNVVTSNCSNSSQSSLNRSFTV